MSSSYDSIMSAQCGGIRAKVAFGWTLKLKWLVPKNGSCPSKELHYTPAQRQSYNVTPPLNGNNIFHGHSTLTLQPWGWGDKVGGIPAVSHKYENQQDESTPYPEDRDAKFTTAHHAVSLESH
ncbi:hypothetical protein AC579_5001 [Pseudocercospora musae]|uniref:Uncharacterized protein n=1 Tax=Pseudocercospora musae TaxID=113226 RepID=A0A139IG06_9PEZI|nr:hypothetical protein AC579_5001 [Pseudocercospora musae]